MTDNAQKVDDAMRKRPYRFLVAPEGFLLSEHASIDDAEREAERIAMQNTCRAVIAVAVLYAENQTTIRDIDEFRSTHGQDDR